MKVDNVKKDESMGSMKSTNALMDGYIDLLEERMEGTVNYIESGYKDLDECFGAWLHEEHLIVVAGRPGMGKTSFAGQLAEKISEERSVLFFSLEMSSLELLERSISRRSRVDVQTLKKGEFTDDEFIACSKAINDVSQLNLFLDDGVFDIDTIVKKTKKIKKTFDEDKGRKKVGLVIVDYLQMINAQSKNLNKTLEIGYISTELKKLAKEVKVPVIALAQLNRGLEQRPDKRPVMSDLRDSGQIEQDADSIFFIYRDDVYNSDSSDKGIAEIICGKNRHGPRGTVKMGFGGKRVEFRNLIREMRDD